MSQSDLQYVSQTLLASAFYYGLMGGVSGYVLAWVTAQSFGMIRRLFKGR